MDRLHQALLSVTPFAAHFSHRSQRIYHTCNSNGHGTLQLSSLDNVLFCFTLAAFVFFETLFAESVVVFCVGKVTAYHYTKMITGILQLPSHDIVFCFTLTAFLFFFRHFAESVAHRTLSLTYIMYLISNLNIQSSFNVYFRPTLYTPANVWTTHSVRSVHSLRAPVGLSVLATWFCLSTDDVKTLFLAHTL